MAKIDKEIRELEKALLEGACTLDMDAYSSIKELYMSEIASLKEEIKSILETSVKKQKAAAIERARKHWKEMYEKLSRSYEKLAEQKYSSEKAIHDAEVRISWLVKWKKQADATNDELKKELEELQRKAKILNSKDSADYWMKKYEASELCNSSLQQLNKEYKNALNNSLSSGKEYKDKYERLKAEVKALKSDKKKLEAKLDKLAKLTELTKQTNIKKNKPLDMNGAKMYWNLHVYNGLSTNQCSMHRYEDRAYSQPTISRAIRRYDSEKFIPSLLQGGTISMDKFQAEHLEALLKYSFIPIVTGNRDKLKKILDTYRNIRYGHKNSSELISFAA